LDCTGHTPAIRESRNSSRRLPACAVLTHRNPTLLLWFAAAFLFRLEAREFVAFLFQSPQLTQQTFGRRPLTQG